MFGHAVAVVDLLLPLPVRCGTSCTMVHTREQRIAFANAAGIMQGLCVRMCAACTPGMFNLNVRCSRYRSQCKPSMRCAQIHAVHGPEQILWANGKVHAVVALVAQGSLQHSATERQ